MGKRVHSAITMFLVFTLLVWMSASADVLHLKDGGEIEGTVIETTLTTLTISTSTGVREYPISAVDYVERDELGAGPGESEEVAGIAESDDQPPDACNLLESLSLSYSPGEWLFVGGVTAVGAIVALAGIAARDEITTAIGVTAAQLGAIGLSVLIAGARAKQAFTKIASSASSAREGECGRALHKLAEEGRFGRMLAGITELLVGFLGSVLTANDYARVTYSSLIASGAYRLVFPSRQEKALKQYEMLASPST